MVHIEFIMLQKQKRQELLSELISTSRIERQDQLADALDRQGFSVTQSSISRDLLDLGVVKTHGYYSLPVRPRSEAGFRIISLDTAGENMIVGRTRSGLASAVTVRIDAERIPEIVGTIAGDDTIFIAVKDAKNQRVAMKKIWGLFE
jgi:transcriptional regulator of arginine metabolism